MATVGTAVHSEYAIDLAHVLLSVARDETKEFRIQDRKKLEELAKLYGIDIRKQAMHDIARHVAEKIIDDFGRKKQAPVYISAASETTQKHWKDWKIVPQGIDAEVVESLYRTAIGVGQDPDDLLLSALRVALADGWGASMISVELSDILFGTQRPVETVAGIGIFEERSVNIVLAGRHPTFARILSEMASEPELTEYAKTKNAEGINIGTISMIGHEIPTVGGFSSQELIMMTGIIDAVVIDEDCIMPSLGSVAGSFHTKILNTSSKVTTSEAVPVAYKLSRARDTAAKAIRTAIDNYPNRTGMGERISVTFPVLTGFSEECFTHGHGGPGRASYRKLNDAIAAGTIRGIAVFVGNDNPRVQATGIHLFLIRELIEEDVLVFATEGGAAACAVAGYLDPAGAIKYAGPGLRKACEKMGLPPVLSFGGAIDNARVLTVLSSLASEKGPAYEIGEMPAVALAPEWLAEREITVGCYFAASGIPTIFGGVSPVKISEELSQSMKEVWLERFKGALLFEPDPEKMLDLALGYIDRAREELKFHGSKDGRAGRPSKSDG